MIKVHCSCRLFRVYCCANKVTYFNAVVMHMVQSWSWSCSEKFGLFLSLHYGRLAGVS